MKQDLLFWELAHYLVVQQHYRMINLSPSQNELWLENTSMKDNQLIRLLRYDIDWSNWIKRDLELVEHNVQRVKKQLGKRKLSVMNIYVTEFPPVDDYSELIPSKLNGNDDIKSLLLTNEQANDMIQGERIFQLFQRQPQEDIFDWDRVEWLKRMTISSANNQIKKEKQLFQYGKPFFTYIFIALQLIMYYLLESNGGSQNIQTLIEFGAKENSLIEKGEWWRFLTPIILHIGFFHLLMNTFALYYLGTAVERIFGRVRFLFIYIIAGFMGTVASFVFTQGISAGASGAIFGCFGALLYFGSAYPKIFFRTMGTNIILVIGLNLLLGFSIPGIDNAGHLGGLVGGFLAAGSIGVPKKTKWWLQILFLGGLLVLTSLLLQTGYR